jgi:hypothetical protein
MRKPFMFIVVLSFLSTLLFAAPAPAPGTYVILHNSPLYQDNPDKTLKVLEYLTLGDAVTLLGRTATFKEGSVVRDFTRIRAFSGKEGWVRTQFIAVKAVLAVVKADDSLIFSEPRDVKVTGRSISSMTVVGALSEGSTSSFSKVQGWDAPKGALFTESTYMMPSDLTISESDVQAAILYTVATATKNADVKKTLLKLALSKYPDSMFASRIDAVLNGTPEGAAPVQGSSAGRVPASVHASSTLPPETASKYRYDAALMFDGNPLTAWAEGNSGSGEGETIEVSFASPVRFDTIAVMPGFFDSRWFKNNARVKEMQIELFNSAGDKVLTNNASFNDEMAEQGVSLGETEIARALFTVTAVYAPEKKDLAISEISFWSKGAKLPIQAKTE